MLSDAYLSWSGPANSWKICFGAFPIGLSYPVYLPTYLFTYLFIYLSAISNYICQSIICLFICLSPSFLIQTSPACISLNPLASSDSLVRSLSFISFLFAPSSLINPLLFLPSSVPLYILSSFFLLHSAFLLFPFSIFEETTSWSRASFYFYYYFFDHHFFFSSLSLFSTS